MAFKRHMETCREGEKAQVLFLDPEIFLMKSEPQHGISWVNKFHKTIYGRLVFGTPLCKEEDFDPILDSIYGATGESSHEREASAQSDEPMKNPYEQPSKRRGRSQEREEPQDSWEQQRSSSGSSEPP